MNIIKAILLAENVLLLTVLVVILIKIVKIERRLKK